MTLCLGRRGTSTFKFFVIFLCHYPAPFSVPTTRRNNMTLIFKRYSNRSDLVLLCCLVPSFCKSFSHLLLQKYIERIRISLYRRRGSLLTAIITLIVDYPSP